MGHRGVIGFQFNKKVRSTYVHWALPCTTGQEIIDFLSKLNEKQLLKLQAKAKKIRWVAPNSEATPSDIKKFKKFKDTSVASHKLEDWFCLLHKTQGAPMLLYLFLGELDVLIDNTENLKDSLINEWGYILNFDQNTLDIYMGDQTTPDLDNILGHKVEVETAHNQYYPCKKVLAMPLNKLSYESLEKFVNKISARNNENEGL